MQRKPRLFFIVLAWLACGLLAGCHSGPVFTDDAAYRAIERKADRNSASLAVTGTGIAAGAERIDGHAERVEVELDTLEAAIRDSGLADTEKEPLLYRVAVVQEENTALRGEVGILREDAGRLNAQLAEQRKIDAALSEEHDKRETAAAVVQIELEGTKEELAAAKGRCNLYLVILIAVGIAVLGYAAFRVLRFLRGIPV